MWIDMTGKPWSKAIDRNADDTACAAWIARFLKMRGVDRLFGRTQRDAAALEFVDNVLQVLQRARETVVSANVRQTAASVSANVRRKWPSGVRDRHAANLCTWTIWPMQRCF